MKNILFVRTVDFDESLAWDKPPVPPLGLMYLDSAIRKEFEKHYNIKIVDMNLNRMSAKELRQVVSEFSPDILGCSTCSNEDKCMHEVANMIKEFKKDCKVIVGGPHATIYYDDILKNRNIDVAIIGEGERTIIELLRAFEDKVDISRIPGIAFPQDGRIVFTGPPLPIRDLDNLPFPAWDSIDIDTYSRKNAIPMTGVLASKRYMSIFTSRGCPYGCIYCHSIFGKEFRKRSAENVFQEIKELHDKYGIDEIQIFDDIFNLDILRAKKICDLIINSKIKIKLAFPNALRGDIMDEDLILKLKQAGTYFIVYALETASPRLQKLINKNINIERLKEAINFSSRLGMITGCCFMLGFPTETMEEIRQTIEFACNSNLHMATFFIVTVQKGTGLFSLVKEIYPNFNIDFNFYNYSVANKNYEKFLNLPLEKIQGEAHFKFYLNINRLIKLFILIPHKVIYLTGMMSFLLHKYIFLIWKRKIIFHALRI